MTTKPILVIPSQVLINAQLTIRSADNPFTENAYVITNEIGKVIRKGSISSGNHEFCLSMVGMATGVYRIIVGQVQEKFTVI